MVMYGRTTLQHVFKYPIFSPDFPVPSITGTEGLNSIIHLRAIAAISRP